MSDMGWTYSTDLEISVYIFLWKTTSDGFTREVKVWR